MIDDDDIPRTCANNEFILGALALLYRTNTTSGVRTYTLAEQGRSETKKIGRGSQKLLKKYSQVGDIFHDFDDWNSTTPKSSCAGPTDRHQDSPKSQPTSRHGQWSYNQEEDHGTTEHHTKAENQALKVADQQTIFSELQSN